MMQRPLFSIITVTYNAANTIVPTVQSVREQTCRLFEHIIVDGKSVDETVSLARKHGVEGLRISCEKDSGLYDAMNKGLDMASGDYVIFLNAGDRFHSPDTLQKIADAALGDHDPGVIYGQTNIVDAQGQRLGDRHLRAPRQLTPESFRDGMVVCHQAFVVLRKLVPKYDLRYRFSADYDWCIKCLRASRRNVYIDDVLIDYLSDGLTTANRRASLRERFKIMSKNYGFFPTLWRHFGFISRFMRWRRVEKSFNNK